jgi:alkanesulfonate monooxygenase SsuD/methylene tetrahydromethanopterin reductase-like flavin-dependent oxidoreductase (luciferase family)
LRQEAMAVVKLKRHLHLLAHMCTGPTHHSGAWRHPESDAHQVLDAARYENLAVWLERGLFDGMFIVDYQNIEALNDDGPTTVVHRGGQMAMLEPILVLTER